MKNWNTQLSVANLLLAVVTLLLVACAFILWRTEHKEHPALTEPVETSAKLKPSLVSGKPALPMQVWIDPGVKLDLAQWKNDTLQWSTRPAAPGEKFESYEVKIGESTVTFIEQKPIR